MRLTVVSNLTVDVRVVVEDEFTYFADGRPGVAGASVRLVGKILQDRLTNETGSDGEVLFHGVREGAYEVSAQALKHGPNSAVIHVRPDMELPIRLFLPRAAISYVWSVTPTTIEDKYTFELIAEYETYVPMPVVTIEPPHLDMDRLSFGDIKQIDFVITNHGLIAANELVLLLPTTHPVVRFHQLTPLAEKVPANSSIVYSVAVTIASNDGETTVSTTLPSGTTTLDTTTSSTTTATTTSTITGSHTRTTSTTASVSTPSDTTTTLSNATTSQPGTGSYGDNGDGGDSKGGDGGSDDDGGSSSDGGAVGDDGGDGSQGESGGGSGGGCNSYAGNLRYWVDCGGARYSGVQIRLVLCLEDATENIVCIRQNPAAFC